MEEKDINISNLVYRIAQKDDEQAFRRFFDLFYARLLQLAHMILRNNEIAEDTVLEVFARIWNNREDLPKIENLNKYLYVMVKNRSLDQLRKNKDMICEPLSRTNIREQIVSQNPENILLEKELLEKINQAVLNLPEKCQIVYRLVKEEEHSYQEVADLLNISRKTVDNHINLAMNRIRSCILEYVSQIDRPGNKNWRILRMLLLGFIS
ncbi:MAG: RNA polymerase sigma-70 factor [Cytophagales bacterium]|nr:RNA polymerase sigma-70 factor [Cytophagales bacterium]